MPPLCRRPPGCTATAECEDGRAGGSSSTPLPIDHGGAVSDDQTSFDLLILGGGSGGYACALRGAELGLRIGLVEEDKLGGTCLHRGCIPTRALLRGGGVAAVVRDADEFGIGATLGAVDMAALNAYKDGVV